ncbi:MAG: 50S ribosomal protein L3 N(5)-glutamine methyltransferase [Pseudomonadota bacterium]
MQTANTSTAGELIDEVAEHFRTAKLTYGHGTDNPDDEAAWLVFSVLGLSFSDGPDAYDRAASSGELARVRELAKRRADERRPLAYLLNEAWFCGLEFFVDERVLVPRSPIAELVVERFEPWVDAERVDRIMDLGTGSGCIAIACALAFRDAKVDAVDVSADALDVAASNVEKHAVGDRVSLLRSDFFAEIPPNRYQLIVSNPPYVDRDDMADRSEEYRHEPELGLASGDDGLDATRVILKQASRFLDDGGILVCEVGNSRPALEDAFPRVPFTWLEFEHGGEGVFLLTKTDLERLD